MAGLEDRDAFRRHAAEGILLLGTLDYVSAVTFGDDRVVRAAVRAVDRRHAPVGGGSAEAAPAYDAFDADAQRWVASMLLAVALHLHERLRGPLDAIAVLWPFLPSAVRHAPMRASLRRARRRSRYAGHEPRGRR